MRTSYILFFTLWIGLNAALAQVPTEVQITVLYKNGKPLVSNVFAHTNQSKFYRELAPNGTIRFNLNENDTVFIVSGKKYAVIPVDGRNEIVVCFDKSNAYDPSDPSFQYTIGKLPKFKPGKIYETENIAAYGNLIMLIKAKFPAILLRIERGTMHAFLQNSSPSAPPPSSGPYIAPLGHQDGNAIGAAAIFIDGQPCPSIEEANRIVDITTLKTITIEKPDIVLGKGGNGRINITSIH